MTAIENGLQESLGMSVEPVPSQKTSPQHHTEEKQVEETQEVDVLSVDTAKQKEQPKSAAEKEVAVDMKDKEAIVDKLNETMKNFENGVRFVMGEDGNNVVVEVYNKDSGDVIRRIPPEGVLKSAKNISELLGLLIDEVG